MQLLAFLKRPYPFYSNSRQAILLVLAISSFITLFCFIFRPFGIDDSSIGNHVLVSVGFGSITLLVCLFNMVLMPKVFPKVLSNENWTITKELLWVVWILLGIALFNWVYTNLFYDQPRFDLLSYAVVAFYTILIGLMPAIGVILYKESQQLKSQVAAVSEKIMTTREGVAQFISENEKEKLSIPRGQILLISSAGNYCEIFFERENKLEKALLRNKISNLEKSLQEFPEIIRCHRKHIINIDKVLMLDGNTQGYKVKLFHMNELIPVSRSYTHAVSKVRMS